MSTLIPMQTLPLPNSFNPSQNFHRLEYSNSSPESQSQEEERDNRCDMDVSDTRIERRNNDSNDSMEGLEEAAAQAVLRCLQISSSNDSNSFSRSSNAPNSCHDSSTSSIPSSSKANSSFRFLNAECMQLTETENSFSITSDLSDSSFYSSATVLEPPSSSKSNSSTTSTLTLPPCSSYHQTEEDDTDDEDEQTCLDDSLSHETSNNEDSEHPSMLHLANHSCVSKHENLLEASSLSSSTSTATASIVQHQSLQPQQQYQEITSPRSLTPITHTQLPTIELDQLHSMLCVECRLQLHEPNAAFVAYRVQLIEWLNVCCIDRLGLQLLTARSALALMDYILASHTLPQASFRLIGASCILIAAKYSEAYHIIPTLSSISSLMHGLYSIQQIAQAELFVLSTLGWRADAITVHHFVAFHRAMQTPELLHPSLIASNEAFMRCVDFLSDIVIFDYSLSRVYRPSLLCEGIFHAAHLITGLPQEGAILCAYSPDEIQTCSQRVLRTMHQISHHRTIRNS